MASQKDEKKKQERKSVAVIGDSYVDLQTFGLQTLPKWGQDTLITDIKMLPGGSAANTARHIGGLGLRVELFSSIGDDSFSKFFLSCLKEEDLVTYSDSMTILEDMPSATCVVLSGPHDRAFVSCNTSCKAFTVQHINRDVLLKSDHLHIGGYFNCIGLQGDDLVDLIKFAKENGMTVSLDPQFDAEDKWTGKDDNIFDVLPLLDVFMPSEAEALGVTKTKTIDDAMKRLIELTHKDAILIIKIGDKGVLCHKNGKFFNGKPKRVKVVDTTGAGDAFNAGFLVKFVTGFDLQTACDFGCAAGSLTVTKNGACATAMTLNELEGFFDSTSNL